MSDATAAWLIDKSAYVGFHRSPDREEWANRINRGLVHASSLTLLEIGFSARSAVDWDDVMRTALVSSFVPVHLTPAMETRALRVQRLLAGLGRHRAPSVPDLLIAAAAERLGLVILHVDKDFELIAEVTGQPVERLRL